MAGIRITQLAPSGVPARRYGSFAGRIPVVAQTLAEIGPPSTYADVETMILAFSNPLGTFKAGVRTDGTYRGTLDGNRTGTFLRLRHFSQATKPTTGDLLDREIAIWNDTTAGAKKIVFRDGAAVYEATFT